MARAILGDLTSGTLARAVDATLRDQDKRLRNAVYAYACVHALTGAPRNARQAAFGDLYSHTAFRFLRTCVTKEREAEVILPADLAASLEQASALMLRHVRTLQAESGQPQRLMLSLAKSAKTLSAFLPDICRFSGPAEAAHLGVQI